MQDKPLLENQSELGQPEMVEAIDTMQDSIKQAKRMYGSFKEGGAVDEHLLRQHFREPNDYDINEDI